METILGIVVSILISFGTSYFMQIRKTDKLQYEIDTLKKSMHSIESLKLEECISRLEYQYSHMEHILNKMQDKND